MTPHLTLQGHSTQTTMCPKFLKISAPQQLWTRMKSVARTPPVIQILYFSWHLPLVLVLLWPVFCCPFFSWPRSTSSDHPSWTSQASPLRRNSISKLAKSFKRCALDETRKKLLNIDIWRSARGYSVRKVNEHLSYHHCSLSTWSLIQSWIRGTIERDL